MCDFLLLCPPRLLLFQLWWVHYFSTVYKKLEATIDKHQRLHGSVLQTLRPLLAEQNPNKLKIFKNRPPLTQWHPWAWAGVNETKSWQKWASPWYSLER